MPVTLEHLCENVSPPLTISICQNSFAVSPLLPFLKTFIWIIIHGSRCWIFLPLQSCKFSIHRRSSSLTKLPSVAFKDPFFCRANICSCWRYQNWILLVKWPGQLITAIQLSLLDFLRLKFLVAWRSLDISEIHSLVFFLKEPYTFSLYLLLRPETLFVSHDEELLIF